MTRYSTAWPSGSRTLNGAADDTDATDATDAIVVPATISTAPRVAGHRRKRSRQLNRYIYAAGSDEQITCAVPGDTANTANCEGVADPPTGRPTDVGSYTAAASPNGTFDQHGNVSEWNEAILWDEQDSGTVRGLRGGGFTPFRRRFPYGANPAIDGFDTGFRVASLPEPGAGLLEVTALLSLAAFRRLRSSSATASI